MNQSQPPAWFWVVSGLGLIWNLLGVGAFFQQLTMDLTQLAEAEREFFENVPIWATAGFLIAVASGTLGCLALLLRREWAVPLLVLCVAGILVQTFHSLALTNSVEIFGPQGLILPFMTFTIAVALTWFATSSRRRGWIGEGP